jgi:hypothetical protein
VTPDIRYVAGPPSSQSFFNEISATALPGWYFKWRADVGDLRREHAESLVRETHNLAVRTQYKYRLSNEAVAVLAFALMSFVLAAILILIAAARLPVNPASGTGSPPLSLNITVRAILAAVFFGYCALQLLATQRGEPPTVLELAYPAHQGHVSASRWRMVYVTVGALVVPQLLLLPTEPRVARVVLAVALPVLAWLILGLALPWYSKSEEDDQRAAARVLMPDPAIALPEATSRELARQHNAVVRRSWLAAGAIAACYAALGVVAAELSRYREILGLAGAYAAGLLLAASAVWQLGRKSARSVQQFRQDVEKPAAG